MAEDPWSSKPANPDSTPEPRGEQKTDSLADTILQRVRQTSTGLHLASFDAPPIQSHLPPHVTLDTPIAALADWLQLNGATQDHMLWALADADRQHLMAVLRELLAARALIRVIRPALEGLPPHSAERLATTDYDLAAVEVARTLP